MSAREPLDLSLPMLSAAYASGTTSPTDVLSNVLARIAAYERKNVWIYVLSVSQIDAQLRQIEADRRAGKELPLYGIPFAVKDNIDVAGVPTTAACPAFAYTPSRSADVVQRLCDAGAIVVGKTNLDQFATGLVGTRSPFGACENSIDPAWISGGSSSGSAVSVAGGLVSFSLGTDTAGSGRVPASFNNIVGLKPTVGMISTEGVVPACKSLDCVSIFATTCADAKTILSIAAESAGTGTPLNTPFRCGVPRRDQLEFFGNTEAAKLFEIAIEKTRELGGSVETFDYSPFKQTAELLYEGPWVVERMLATGALFKSNPQSLRPEIRTILEGAGRFNALDVFEGMYKLEKLRNETATQWRAMDVMLLPTAGTIYRIAEVEADPMRLNRNLGYYTNFVNLLNLSALAVPNGFLNSGLPLGVTFIAPARQDIALLEIGAAFHALSGKGKLN
ncbi:MAG: allophanate hydrolase [Planctomycetota bacterium]